MGSFLQDMLELFQEADGDGSGKINKAELDKFLSDDKVVSYMASHQLDVHDVSSMFDLLDATDTGEIAIDDWMLGCLRMKGQARCLDVMRIAAAVHSLQQQLEDIQASPTKVG